MAYPGGKNGDGVFQAIINLMPPHSTYVEAFVGAGAILRAKKPAPISIAVDADPAALNLTMQALNLVGSPILTLAAAIAGLAGADVRTSELGETGAGPPSPIWWVHGDGIKFLERYPWRGDGSELVYADPPYYPDTRTKKRIYRYELSQLQHRRLCRVFLALAGRGVNVMVSGYRCRLYQRWLGHWNSVSFPAMTRGGLRDETVWFNFERPSTLHDYSFVGADYRERESHRRMVKRWEAKLRKMDPLKRNALFAAIGEMARATLSPAVHDRGRS